MTREELMTEMLKKGVEHIQCCRHMHMRGAADVIKEAKQLCDQAKQDGITFRELCEFAMQQKFTDEEFSKFKEEIRSDPIMMCYQADMEAT